MKQLLQIAGQRKTLLLASCTLAVIHSVLSLVPYALVFYIIKELTQSQPNFTTIQQYVVYAIVMVIVSMVAFLLSGILSHIAAFNILYGLRKTITEKVGILPMGYLSHRNSGAFKKIISDDVERIETFVAHQIPDFVKAVALPLLTLGYLFSEDWRLALISCLPLLVLVVIMPLMFGSKNQNLTQKYHHSLEEMSAGIVEYVRAMPVMKIFQQSAETFDKYGKKVLTFHRFVSDWIRHSSPPFAIFMSFASNAMLPVLVLGLYLYFHNGLTLATLLFFLILGTGYMRPVFAMSNMAMQLQLIEQGVQQIDKILEAPVLPETHTPQEPSHYDIRFDKVSFAYDGEHYVLNDINFIAKEGSITALVGPSGAGKSTVGQLLSRFWDVQEGNISIGGVDIRQLSTEKLMQMVSFVFQDSFMFAQTMYENIRMGMNKTKEEVIAAAQAAQIHDFIMSLPKGYDTLFGQQGVHLSGGEQQRFQLARAILKNAPILVLDEATAFADPENEYKIQQAFSELIKGKTVLVIAHRLSTIITADQIIVFEKGEINAIGTHNELLQSSELYQRMWNAHNRAKEWNI
ncbi:ABC transporter ATP-binding protein [Capnocytophaga genosp. AHN8471]|uniref:ABC transporter ATP-binding protein n=1 Tax=Capnocytophaga genosp. AHN8471 TaxID=327574 RepID=A0ABS1YYW7_9FLAO|nr:ABC transporter ATP-binding protein [Capnocytophaga genosp. AHN8471]MBM0651614.1 ABC transporter ATP-binding protein [Capnocytophaga genosp. AHN8471]MBM0662048.1 ABC transporter ATP-binding protein [Capnocytophaga genosp. AHN8471]